MEQDGVVLLHGIFRTRFSMRGLEKHLQRAGYRTLNIGYPSTKHSIEALVETIQPRIEAFAQATPGQLHFIGHSMGGLLIRAYIHRFRPQRMGRVVMLGTPNSGSEVADFIKDWRWFKKFYGPAGQQLVTTQDAFKHIFGTVDYELGIIAGRRSLDPIGSYIIGEPNDGKVSIARSKLDGMKDHITVAVDHSFLPMTNASKRHVSHFLKFGNFQRP